MALAKAALEIAQAEQRADLIPEVQMTLSGLRSAYSTYNERLAATP
jgi:predicted fused transcriptional regulator/phosphomethylpyrimidine kinase